jgi:hypothetical protein
MKIKPLIVTISMLTLAAGVFTAADARSQESEVDRLRRTLEAQKQNPGKIIRDAGPVQTAQSNPPVGQPARPAATPAPKPAAPPPAKVAEPVSTYTIPTNFPSYTELEDAYLNRKITARRFEEALKLLEKHQKISEDRQVQVRKMMEQHRNQQQATPTSAAEQKKMSEVEGKLDELSRLKAQRDQSATNSPAAASAPLTKRQRLDVLLRQLIEGKITDAEYKEKREKIVLEPD